MKIYGDIQSGNCYKVKLLTSLLDIEHEWIEVDILAKETHSASFLKMNPNGKIPLLELDDGTFISESNAILNYLAYDSNLAGVCRFSKAKVLQWQFFEQYSHEPFIAVARFIAKYLGLPEDRKPEYEAKQAGGHKALKVMEEQLQSTLYLVGNDITIADISLYGYTHVAHEGGFDLSEYPAIQKWIDRIQSHPNYISME
ncbi:glutathione S-transferase family protein [Marinomonas mediterranea]|uniref:Glutathione S-transferase domain n=1 Tax=Marinomonas mediterranea (strain ATCC 700492 / JCM 21426 / NBRC 103028 / MMB-1) TaxID=717774 RepID=F2JYF6_MARM1|nr:glutathione S-transferase family protein [Marinomonas mediterranea]ADZ93085.1 Glutathione S-transferase domain [Marinomonas mediterranea MMB-1]WCN10991.1 glutathione S-transferase family protein [Marinomonas mediterranea]WCN15053.1 glutathione S-transferase family protein [Marinomonas mediterranea]WCN19097.1 glutathione S-transferase family protein [Marinomonas mediterranea MMB-1]